MMRLEDELRRAMARHNPPGDFTARVLARAAQQESGTAARAWRAWFERGRAWRLAGALAGISLAVSAGFMYQQHERAVRGEAAKGQLLLAVRIAGTKLQQAHRQVLRVEEVDQ